VHNQETGLPVGPDLEKELSLCTLLAEAAENRWITGAHDLSDGGFLVAAAELCMALEIGLELHLEGEPFEYSKRADARLFGELPGRVLVTLANDPDCKRLEARAKELGLGFVSNLGKTMEPAVLRVVDTNGDTHEWMLSELQSAYERSIPLLMTH
jgi:phosphoribosylformylglycinamidine synthase